MFDANTHVKYTNMWPVQKKVQNYKWHVKEDKARYTNYIHNTSNDDKIM